MIVHVLGIRIIALLHRIHFILIFLILIFLHQFIFA